MQSTRTISLLLLLLLAAFAVAACGGSDGGDSSVAGGGSEVGGGTADCDQATFDAWAKAYSETEGTTVTLPEGEFECADGWAVMFPTVDDGSGEGYTETVVVQAEGGVWALMDREKVCGTDEASSEVPAALYQKACQTN